MHWIILAMIMFAVFGYLNASGMWEHARENSKGWFVAYLGGFAASVLGLLFQVAELWLAL